MSDFTERVDQLLEERGTSRYAMCKALNMSNGTYSQWQVGSNPNIIWAYKVAVFLGVTVDYLITGENKPVTEGSYFLVDSDEKKLIDIFRELDKSKKADLINIAAVLKNK